jgi:hypothetical protein
MAPALIRSGARLTLGCSGQNFGPKAQNSDQIVRLWNVLGKKAETMKVRVRTAFNSSMRL